MDFATAIEGVQALVARPDKDALIRGKINAAVRSICLSGSYAPDRMEQISQFSLAEQQLTLPVPDRFRRVWYLKYTDRECYLDELTNLQDGNVKDNKYYRTGNNILINLTEAQEQLLFGWYVYPERLQQNTDTNWILQVMPDLIIDLASAYVMGILGARAETAAIGSLARDELAIFVEDALRESQYTVSSGRT